MLENRAQSSVQDNQNVLARFICKLVNELTFLTILDHRGGVAGWWLQDTCLPIKKKKKKQNIWYPIISFLKSFSICVSVDIDLKLNKMSMTLQEVLTQLKYYATVQTCVLRNTRTHCIILKILTLLSSLVGCLCLPGLGGTDKRFLPFSSWKRSCSLTHNRGHVTDNYIPTPYSNPNLNTEKYTFCYCFK